MSTALKCSYDERTQHVEPAVDSEIVATLVGAVENAAWTLSFHNHEGTVVQLGCGGAAGDNALGARLLDEAAALHLAGVADSFEDPLAPPSAIGGRQVVCVSFASTLQQSAVIFAAVVDARAVNAGPLKKALQTTHRSVDAYFRLWQSNALQFHRSASLEAALDALDLGVILIDREGRINFTNAMANAVLSSGTVLRRRGSTLATTTLAETMKLQSTLALAIAMNGEEPAVHALPERSALLKLTAGTERLIVAAVPAKLPADRPGAVAAMVLILNSAGEPEKLVAPACHLYGMSPVETRLACHIVAGRSLQEASQAMRIKEQTARSYLKQVFLKTDVNRQVDLVRLLLSTLIRTHTGAALQSI